MSLSRHPDPDNLLVGHRRRCSPAIALLAGALLVLATGEVASAGAALDWQTITDLPGGHLGDVAAGDGGLIAVGMRGWADGQLATLASSDGVAWQRVEDPVLYGRSWQVAVTHGPYGWVIGGRTFTETFEETVHQAAAWRSADMVEWTPAPYVPDLDLDGINLEYPHEGIRDIVAGGPGYVAVGNDSSGAVIWTSQDGLAWRRVAPLPGAADAVAHAIVALDDGSLVAVGNSRYSAGPSVARVWSSADGTTWRVEPVGVAGMLVDAATDGTRVIAVRANDDQVRGGSALSPPLVIRAREGSWKATGEPSLDGVRVATLASDGERWVLFGTRRTEAGSAVRGDAAWTSDDAVTWLPDGGFGDPFPPGYEPPSVSAIGVAAITWDGERFVAVGALPTDDPNVVRPTVWLGTPETVSLRPVAHDFGRRDIDAGPTAGRIFRVTNIGSGPLAVRRVSLGGADPGQFTIVADGCSGRSIPAAGGCQLKVAFDPAGTGAKLARLRVISDASSSPHRALLTGRGIVLAPDSGARTIVAGTRHACALLVDGRVSCWGDDTFGQLGLGPAHLASAGPATVAGLRGVVELVAGDRHVCARLADGSVRCWGANHEGQLGDGTRTTRRSPVAVRGITGARALAAGGRHTCACLSDGSVRCWGDNAMGQLGDGTRTDRLLPVKARRLSGAVTLAAGAAHTCALRSDARVRCWGANGSGQLGDGTRTDRLTPVTVAGLAGVMAVGAGASHGCAVTGAVAGVHCWGANGRGQLGDGTATGRASPVELALRRVTRLDGGTAHTCAVRGDGSVRCWGLNGAGQLGDGTTTRRLSPVTVGGLAGATRVAAGGAFSCARLIGGSVACWGANGSGQLGDGTTTSSTVPVAVALGSATSPGRATRLGPEEQAAKPAPADPATAPVPGPNPTPRGKPSPGADPDPTPVPTPDPGPTPSPVGKPASEAPGSPGVSHQSEEPSTTASTALADCPPFTSPSCRIGNWPSSST